MNTDDDVIDVFRYSSDQRRAIAAALPSGHQAALSPDLAIETLELAATLYFSRKRTARGDTAQQRDRWSQISRLAHELLHKIEEADPGPYYQLILNEGEVIGESEHENENEKKAELLRHVLRSIGEVSDCNAIKVKSAVGDRQGGRDRERNALCQFVIEVWWHFAGEIKTPSKTKTGGPLARFFTAAAEPILKHKTPSLDALKKLVVRHRDKLRHGKRLPLKDRIDRCLSESVDAQKALVLAAERAFSFSIKVKGDPRQMIRSVGGVSWH